MKPQQAGTSMETTAFLQEAQQHYRQGQPAAAESAYWKILKLEPEQPDALFMLSGLRRQAGDFQAAEALLQRLLTARPEAAVVLSEMALLCYQTGRMPQAEHYARKALASDPGEPQAHYLLGMVLKAANRLDSAEYFLTHLLCLRAPQAHVCRALGEVCFKLGKLGVAEASFAEALRLDPNDVDALLGWATMEEARRKLDKGHELVQQAQAIRPDYAPAYVVQAQLFRREKRLDEALAALDRANLQRAGNELRRYYCFERGHVLDGLGRYDDAFAAYRQANEAALAGGQRTYDRGRNRHRVDQFKDFYSRERMAELRRISQALAVADDGPQPVFIVGFPRSGTTLVEQVLAAHPNICAGQELPELPRTAQFAGSIVGSVRDYPECLNDVLERADARALKALRDYYLVNVRTQGVLEPGVPRFTDKMPLNQRHLPLISLLFPQSPIIHVLRHPLDVILSGYFQDIHHGSFYAYDLNNAAYHYALTDELVSHYETVLEMNYLTVRYEDLVAEPEQNVRRLLAFVGEPWDEGCLEFHNNKTFARTASYAQVSEPLYTRSVYRYQNYREPLHEAMLTLQAEIERLGYRVE